MKIVKHGDKHEHKLKGTCRNCGCQVECVLSETNTLVDKDTVHGAATQWIRCPDCKSDYLWVQ